MTTYEFAVPTDGEWLIYATGQIARAELRAGPARETQVPLALIIIPRDTLERAAAGDKILLDFFGKTPFRAARAPRCQAVVVLTTTDDGGIPSVSYCAAGAATVPASGAHPSYREEVSVANGDNAVQAVIVYKQDVIGYEIVGRPKS